MQVNIDISPALRKGFKKDAAELGITLNAWGSLAFERFLGIPIKQRRALTMTANAQKKYGRHAGRKIDLLRN